MKLGFIGLAAGLAIGRAFAGQSWLWPIGIVLVAWLALLLWSCLAVGVRADLHDTSRHRSWEGNGQEE